MNKYNLHWLDGKQEVVEGNDIADAFSRAGYGLGALPALDWCDEITPEDYGYWEDEFDSE